MKKVINQINLDKYKGLAYLDFETVDISGDVCQIGLKVVDLDNNNVFELSKLVKPFDDYSEISFPGTRTHNIWWDDVKNEDKFDLVWKQIEKYFNGDYLILAHNASFDIRCLKKDLNKYNISNVKFDYGCTMIALRKVLPNLKSYSLAKLALHYNIKFKHHDALEDVLATKQIFEFSFKNIKDYLQKNNQLDFKIQSLAY